jgi:hypothetical protein
VYGKSEHRCSEKPNTEVYGKSEHVERKSSSETKPRKENYKGRLGDQTEVDSKRHLSTSRSVQSKGDDDDKPQASQAYDTPEDEIRAIFRSKTGEEISRDLLNRISEMCELRCVPLSRYVEELRLHVPNSWKNPGGFLPAFARNFKSRARGSATAQQASGSLIAKEWSRCAKCRGIGTVNAVYCDCGIGIELKRVEQRPLVSPVSPAGN